MKSLLAQTQLIKYITKQLSPESGLASELRAETERLPEAGMLSPEDVGQFLFFLVKLLNAENALEIGTFTGYTALRMAEALPKNGKLVCCDISQDWTSIGAKYWRLGQVFDKIDLRIAKAQETLANLEEEMAQSRRRPFDLAFIDADKTSYDAYYESALKLLRPGGVIVFDNVLWSGRVAEASAQDEVTQSLRDLNTKVTTDKRIIHSVLSIGDGLMLALKL